MEGGIGPGAAIHRAILLGDLPRVMALVEQDPQVANAVDDDEYTGLHSACFMGRAGIAAYLVDHGANINQQSTSSLATPLSMACSVGHPNSVQLLLDRGADPAILDKNGATPLMCAAFMGGTDEVHCLLGHKAAAATINHRSGALTALELAGLGGYKDIVRMLLKAGADPMLGCCTYVPLTQSLGRYECTRLFEVRLAQP